MSVVFAFPMRSIPAAAIQAAFEENFRSRGELGAAASIWLGERETLSLAGGACNREGTREWTGSTLALIWSATKGVAAATVLHALEQARISLTRPVASLWPEFAQNGKAGITLLQALSHQAGLPALGQGVSVLDHAACAAAIAAQTPYWPPGSAHGYHTRTFGPLVDEILRRVVPGTTLGRYWREFFGEPFGLDVWIGLPDALHDRVATSYSARVAATSLPNPEPLYRALAEEGSLTRRSFASPSGLHVVTQMLRPEVWRAELPAFGGIASARGLAKFYALLARREEKLFSLGAFEAMSRPVTSGSDRVLCTPTAFSTGFMLDPLDAQGAKQRSVFGPSVRAYGHPGAGGIHAFADPENGVAFAYVMNQMELGVFPNRKALSVVEALYGTPTD